MSEEQLFYAPNHPPEKAPTPRHREHLWAIRRASRQYDCELIDHGTWGTEVEVLCNLEWFYRHRCDTRELAIAEADDRKAQYLRDGGVLVG